MTETIKVLSIRQPWAWLICSRIKDVENRTWKTNYRGRLYIHAGKSFDWNAIPFCVNINRPLLASLIKAHFVFSQKLRLSTYDEFGAIIGYVDFVDCVQNSRSIWAEPGLFHWKFDNANFIDPIPLKGQLGIFEVDREILGDEV